MQHWVIHTLWQKPSILFYFAFVSKDQVNSDFALRGMNKCVLHSCEG